MQSVSLLSFSSPYWKKKKKHNLSWKLEGKDINTKYVAREMFQKFRTLKSEYI